MDSDWSEEAMRDDGLFPGEREDCGFSSASHPLFVAAWSAFVSIAVAAHNFPDSEFYADFKFWVGALILLTVALGSLAIAAALTYAVFHYCRACYRWYRGSYSAGWWRDRGF
jgi:hypothetical protein